MPGHACQLNVCPSPAFHNLVHPANRAAKDLSNLPGGFAFLKPNTPHPQNVFFLVDLISSLSWLFKYLLKGLLSGEVVITAKASPIAPDMV